MMKFGKCISVRVTKRWKGTAVQKIEMPNFVPEGNNLNLQPALWEQGKLCSELNRRTYNRNW